MKQHTGDELSLLASRTFGLPVDRCNKTVFLYLEHLSANTSKKSSACKLLEMT
jgi:hypothetical protein